MAIARISPATSDPARSQRRSDEPGSGVVAAPVRRREPRHAKHVRQDVCRHGGEPHDEARLVEAQHGAALRPEDDESHAAREQRGRGQHDDRAEEAKRRVRRTVDAVRLVRRVVAREPIAGGSRASARRAGAASCR